MHCKLLTLISFGLQCFLGGKRGGQSNAESKVLQFFRVLLDKIDQCCSTFTILVWHCLLMPLFTNSKSHANKCILCSLPGYTQDLESLSSQKPLFSLASENTPTQHCLYGQEHYLGHSLLASLANRTRYILRASSRPYLTGYRLNYRIASSECLGRHCLLSKLREKELNKTSTLKSTQNDHQKILNNNNFRALLFLQHQLLYVYK